MKKTEKHALTVRIALLVMLDILFMQVASFASLWIRHEFDFQAVEETFIHTVWRYMPLNILVTLAVFSMFHLYTSLWKYASITELSCIVAAVAFIVTSTKGMAQDNISIPNKAIRLKRWNVSRLSNRR